MSQARASYGKIQANEQTPSRTIFDSANNSLRIEYDISSLSQLTFTAIANSRDVSIQIVSNDVSGDITLEQSLDGILFSQITGDGLPITATSVGTVDSDIINISGIAGTYLKIIYDKTAAGGNPFVAVNYIGTGA